YVTRIFRVHGRQHAHLKTLYRLFHSFKMEMEEHSIKEETEVFPLIKAYVQSEDAELLKQIKEANEELEAEHDVAGDLLKEIREVTNNFRLPADACGSYQITYDRLKSLEADTMQH